MKYKIIIEQIGETAWTWEIRDVVPKRLGGQGKVASSGSSGTFGCYASPLSAMAESLGWIARQPRERDTP